MTTLDDVARQVEHMAGIVEEHNGRRPLRLHLPPTFSEEQRDELARLLPPNITLADERDAPRDCLFIRAEDA